MKVLSLTEPYASLVKDGVKKIETRSWKTNYRGRLYIHVSSTPIPVKCRNNSELMNLVDYNNLNFGHIICSCYLEDCVLMTDSFIEKIKNTDYNEYIAGEYAPGRYAWILKDLEVLDNPIKVGGHLGIWNYME